MLALLVSLTATLPAYADEAADVAAARQFGSEGVNLADEGKCKEAIEKLERAEKLRHAPTTAGRLGECEIDVGRIVTGTERLQRLLREPPAANAPPAFTTALQRAQQVLDKALPRIGVLHVAVVAPPGTKVALSVDGEKISDVFIDADRPTDPGTHTVQASAPGFLPATARVSIKDGETKRVDLKLEADPNYKVAVVPPPETTSPTTPPTPPPAEEPASSRVPAYAALGVGVVGVAIGSITGIMAMGRKSDATTNCPQSRCIAGSQGEADLSAAKTLGTASTVGFIVGGVGLATGVVLLFTASSSSPSTRASLPPARTVHPEIGVGYAGVRGTF